MARRLQDAKMRRLKRKQQEMERVSGGASPVHHSHSTAGMGGAVDTGHHRWQTACSVTKHVGAPCNAWPLLVSSPGRGQQLCSICLPADRLPAHIALPLSRHCMSEQG